MSKIEFLMPVEESMKCIPSCLLEKNANNFDREEVSNIIEY